LCGKIQDIYCNCRCAVRTNKKEESTAACVIAGFRYGVNGVFALLRCYAEWIVDDRRYRPAEGVSVSNLAANTGYSERLFVIFLAPHPPRQRLV